MKLIAAGFSEIMTPTFVATGDIAVVKAIASDKGFLRTTLVDGVRTARELNEKNTDILIACTNVRCSACHWKTM
jgi:ferredoxin